MSKHPKIEEIEMKSVNDFINSAKSMIYERQYVKKAVEDNWAYISASLAENLSLLQIRRTLEENGVNAGRTSGFNSAVRKKQGIKIYKKSNLCIKCQNEILYLKKIGDNEVDLKNNSEKMDYRDNRHKVDF